MTDNKFINDEKYHTCGRCKYDYTPDNEYPCKDCIHGTDFRKDLWEYNEEKESCEDCISREKALNVVHKYFEHYLQLNDDICLDGLRSLPSVTPKEKTGHWIQQPRYDGDDQPDLVCPNCGFKISWWDMGNFCAKCGTGLKGGAE